MKSDRGQLTVGAVLAVVSLLVVGCGLTDRRESTARDYLTETVTGESQGAITLDTFEKTNGYDQQAQGLQLYVLEWQGQLGVQREVWKGGDAFVGYWQDFSALPARPGGFMAATWKRFSKGATIRLTGESTLLKTERGWRVQQLTVKTWQLVNPGIDFLGTWNGYYSPGAGAPDEDKPSYEYLITQENGRFKVTSKFLKDGSTFSWVGMYADGKIIMVGADGRPEPPDQVSGPAPEVTLLSDGNLRIIQEGEIRLRRAQ